ncbi:MAG: serine O-acetyltransferase [Pseudomonadota bacterium]
MTRTLDPIWSSLRVAAETLTRKEPALASLVHSVVLAHDRLEDALSFRLAQKLASAEISALALRDLAAEAILADQTIVRAARADISAVMDRDPACKTPLQPVLYFKGFQALQTHRIAHWFWNRGRLEIAFVLQMRMAEVFGVDIHPGARMGQGIMIDHATGVVIGETAIVEDDVSMLQGVTLGGTGKESGDRHPKIGRGVLIGANASILGNIRIGECSRVGAGSVVLHDVPPCKTVAGVPAKIVGDGGCEHPSRAMDHLIS